MKKLLFVLGSRGEWGYIKPIIEKSRDYGYESEICVTNMMLLPKHGNLLNEIVDAGFFISSRILSSVSGDSRESMAKSIGLMTQSFVDVLNTRKPDWVILAGDRAEQLGAAIASTYMYIPTAHIQAGERSGNIDGVTRHAISKLVHLHFAANRDASIRLAKMGEQDFRIVESGAPQLDSLMHDERPTLRELLEQGFVPNSPYALICFHPVTEDFEEVADQISFILEVSKNIHIPRIWILPNNDAGGDMIRDAINRDKNSLDKVYANLPRETYTSILEHACFLFGNSSSGILEAPSFKVPVINIGRRQANRVSAANVLHVDFDMQECLDAVEKVQTSEFKLKVEKVTNPYGDGDSSVRILESLRSISPSNEFLVKTIVY